MSEKAALAIESAEAQLDGRPTKSSFGISAFDPPITVTE